MQSKLENTKDIENIVNLSRKARNILEIKSNKFINSLLKMIASKILEKKTNNFLSSLAVKETKFGNIEDKIYKNQYKTNNLLFDLDKIEMFEPIFYNKKNIFEIYKPIGLICGVTPSTNPIATTLNYVLNSIKARNSIIICPNPRSYNTVNELIKIIKLVLIKNKLSKEIVNIVPKKIIRDDLIVEVFNLCDKNIVTGNESIIAKVKKSLKPYLVFGKGNVPVIIDSSAKIEHATKSIVQSKSFDNSTSCSAESVAIVDKKIYSKFIKELKKNKVYFLDKNERSVLDEIYHIKNITNPKIIGKKANEILEKINIDCGGTKYNLIVYEVDNFIEGHYIFDEKILPIVGLITSKNIDYSIKIAQKILNINGKGHSAGIYSENKKNIMKFSTHIPVSRIIVNQPHSQSAGGNKNNYLKTTLSLGCGNWGGNILNDNLSLKDFCNITRIVYKKKKK